MLVTWEQRMRLWRRQEPDESAEQAPARLQARPAGQLFPIVKLGEGYDIAEVDAFLGTVQAATADQIREVRFSTVRLRGGLRHGRG